MARAEGIDVSTHNGQIDWSDVAAAGIDFAVQKISEGDFLDPTATAERIALMRRVGILPGGYVYLRPRNGRTGAQEVRQHFWARCTQIGLYGRQRPALRPVLDIEESALDRAGTLTYVTSAIRAVRALTGRLPIIYAGSFWRELGVRERGINCPLWYPEYGVRAPTIRLVPSPWKAEDIAIWQYTDRGRVAGVRADVDRNRLPSHQTLGELTIR